MDPSKVVYRAVVERQSIDGLKSESLEVHAFLTSEDENIRDVYLKLRSEVLSILNITPFKSIDLEDKA